MTPETGHDARRERIIESNRGQNRPKLRSLLALLDPVAARAKRLGGALCIS
jgi:hypothetical protein